MNWKLIIVGGLVFYICSFLLGFVTGPLIHEGLLKPVYQEHSHMWLPELAQDPPDMAALMPRWVATGLVWALVVAALFGKVRPAFSGPGWKKGLVFGLWLAVFSSAILLTWTGVFNLPAKIWSWWIAEGFFYYLICGALLGWLGSKLAPED